jgi:hypothetical protein
MNTNTLRYLSNLSKIATHTLFDRDKIRVFLFNFTIIHSLFDERYINK